MGGVLFPCVVFAQEGEEAKTQLTPAQTQPRIGARVGAFGASLDGIEFKVPGFHGLEPKLALSYQLNGPNDIVGVGWQLLGFSTISRQQKTTGAPQFDETDTFVLDGEELVASTVLGGTHATRNQRYLRIERERGRWRIWDKDGRRMLFKSLDAEGFRFGLTEVRDAAGRTVEYHWGCDSTTRDPEHCYPEAVTYRGVLADLEYEPRPDVISYATGGWLGHIRRRLKAIRVSRGGNRIRRYVLSYHESATTGRSVLETIQEFGKSDQAFHPAIRYELQSPTKGLSEPYTSTYYPLGQYSPNAWNQLFVGDFNGDGHSDLLYHREGGFFVRSGQRAGPISGELHRATGRATGVKSARKSSCEPPRPTKCRDALDVYCADTQTDPKNCGSCGRDCKGPFSSSGKYCVLGECSWCKNPGETRCDVIGKGDYCADLRTDPRNCGRCRRDCKNPTSFKGNYCIDGQCSHCRDASQTRCTPIGGDDYCTDLLTDPRNCGRCGKDCKNPTAFQGNYCIEGQCSHCPDASLTRCAPVGVSDYCADLSSDPRNCGRCGRDCKNPTAFQGNYCIEGECSRCPNAEESWCEVFGRGQYCAALDSDEDNCGRCGRSCPGGSQCSQGECVDAEGSPIIEKPSDLFGWRSFWTADANRDGKDDIIYVGSDRGEPVRLVTLISTGEGFQDPLYSALPTDGTRSRNYEYATWLADFTGDGAPDLVYVDDNLQHYRIMRGDGNGGFLTPTVWGQWSDVAGDRWEGLWPGDFDGDGRMDLLFLDATPAHALWILRSTKSGAEKHLWASLPRSPVFSGGRYWAWAEDFNADGKTDLLVLDQPTTNGGPGTLRWKIYASSGVSGVQVSSNAYQEVRNTNAVRVQDFTGDGRADIMYVRFAVGGQTCHANCPSQNYMLMESNGTGFKPPKVWAEYTPVRNWASIRVADFSGDGLVDLLWVDQNLRNYHLQINQTNRDLYRSSSNGYGAQVKFDYEPSSTWRNRNSPSVFVTLSSVQIWDGRTLKEDGQPQWSVTEYRYGGSAYDHKERRSLGFHYVKTTEPCIEGETACPYTETWYRQSRASAGAVEQQRSCDGEGRMFTALVNEYHEVNESPPYASFVTGIWAADYEGEARCDAERLPQDLGKRRFIDRCKRREGRACVAHHYDIYGNLRRQFDHGAVTRSKDEHRVDVQFFVNEEAYIVGLPAVQIVSSDTEGQTMLSERRWRYDGNTSFRQMPVKGLTTAELEWVDSEKAYTMTSRTYNPRTHNLEEETGPMGARTWYTYDPEYEHYVEGIRNELGHMIAQKWDYGCETVKSRTDVNGQATTTIYDKLCRPTIVRRPLRAWQHTHYCSPETGDPNSCSNASKRHIRVERTGPGRADGTSMTLFESSFLDGLGRTWKTEESGPSASAQVMTERRFDARGNVSLKLGPYYRHESPKLGVQVHTQYDARNRRREVRWRSGARRKWVYSLGGKKKALTRIEAWDEEDHRTLNFEDLQGRLVARYVQEEDGAFVAELAVDYNALGHISRVLQDPSGQRVAWTYEPDSLGRLVNTSDPGRGPTSYRYDAADHLRFETRPGVDPKDPASKSTTAFYYDVLGRLEVTESAIESTKDAPEYEPIKVRYFYDGEEPDGSTPPSVRFAKGRLTLVLDESGFSRWQYDAEGRVTRHEKDIEGASYVFRWGYSPEGSLRWRSFPNQEKLGDASQPWGYDAAGRLSRIPGVVRRIQYTADGRVRRRENANKTKTEYQYNQDRGWLNRILTTGPEGRILQNISYGRYEDGNVRNSEGWIYAYDAQHRFRTARRKPHSKLNPADAAPKVYEYNRLGNIVASPAGTYAYTGKKPHAVTKVGAHHFRYNQAGDLIERDSLRLRYNAQHRLVGLSQKTEDPDSHRYLYDYRGERVKKAVDEKMVTYPSLDYEDHGIQNTLYVRVGSEWVAKRTQRLEPGKARKVENQWIHTDARGSVRHVSDRKGHSIRSLDYLPYGDRVGSGKKLSPTQILESHDFVGERKDKETGFLYLHARYYDPLIGRFISPDPSHPLRSGVGLNPYAYAANNPIGRVDRNGYNSKKTDESEEQSEHYGKDPAIRGLHRELGQLSQNVYQATGAPKGWDRVQSFADPSSGFFAALYRRERGNLYVLAFRGTNDIKLDGVTDVAQGLGLRTSQYQSAVQLAKMAQNFAERKQGILRLTGHSLGGGLASTAALVHDQDAVVFNPAGVHGDTLNRYGASLERSDVLITNYIVEGEVLNTAQDYLPYLRHIVPSSVGRRTYVDRGPRLPISLSGHGSQAYIDSPRTEVEK